MENLIFDDQKMIIKDSSGKEFIADVSPQPNQSTGYINQCQVAARMVECYNAMMFEYADAQDVIRKKNDLQFQVENLKERLDKANRSIEESNQELRKRNDSIIDLKRHNTRLDGEIAIYQRSIRDIYESLEGALVQKNKSAAQLKQEIKSILETVEVTNVVFDMGGENE